MPNFKRLAQFTMIYSGVIAILGTFCGVAQSLPFPHPFFYGMMFGLSGVAAMELRKAKINGQ